MYEISETPGLSVVNDVIVDKGVIKQAIFEHHYSDMVGVIKNQTKLDPIKNDNFEEVQEYFQEKSVENTRLAFRIRRQMVRDIPGNF